MNKDVIIFDNERSTNGKVPVKLSKHALLFLHVQLFPPRQACKLVFGDPKNAAKVRVGEIFLKTQRISEHKTLGFGL